MHIPFRFPILLQPCAPRDPGGMEQAAIHCSFSTYRHHYAGHRRFYFRVFSPSAPQSVIVRLVARFLVRRRPVIYCSFCP